MRQRFLGAKLAIAAFSATAMLLGGCGLTDDEGLFRNRSQDYRRAEELPVIVVPGKLDKEAIGQLYPIPPISDTAVLEEDLDVPRPQPLSENVLEEKVKIQSLGDERWILTNRGPSEVWPRVRNILNRSRIPTARAEASEGVIETVWLKFQDDAENKHRFRFYIQPGVQVNSTEIKVLHDQAPRDDEEVTDSAWPVESESDDREAHMTRLLAESLAGDVSSGTVSLLAQTIGGEKKVEIVTPSVADPYVLMKLDFERAWASVGYSVQRGNYTLIDQNRSEGIYYVNYTPDKDEGEKDGFFSRWFGGKDEEKLAVNFQVLVTEGEDGVEVRVVDKEQTSVERNLAIRLLKDLRSNLS
mgnify:CR=1 FL=1|jgi:outer membrane protein assembly factor BamC